MVEVRGYIAERLFNLLPPIMPLETKFQLVESLWKHVGPSSTRTYYIGHDADLEELSRKVKEHLQKVVIDYEIPDYMEARFDWLSHRDVGVKQRLLNYFRQQERLLLSKALRTQLPILMNHLNSEKGTLTTHVAQILKVGKHEVQIIVNERIHGISEIAPGILGVERDYSWIWWIIGIIILLWLLIR